MGEGRKSVRLFINGSDYKNQESYIEEKGAYERIGFTLKAGILFGTNKFSVKVTEVGGSIIQLRILMQAGCKDDISLEIGEQEIKITDMIASIKLIEAESPNSYSWVDKRSGISIQGFNDLVCIMYRQIN